MKSDVIQYDRTYHLLKNKIESGILPVGSKLPGRSILCKKLGTSERTVRRALELFETDGFLKISPRKRPVVISAFAAPNGRALQNMKKTDAALANDLLQTGILLCYPILKRGMTLCTGDDWRTPETLVGKMDPEQPVEFGQFSSRLWRFFIARNENELLLRAVDSLGFREIDPLPGSLKDRKLYYSAIKKLLQTIKNGGQPEGIEFEKIFSQYRISAEQAGQRQFLQILSPCPILAEAEGLEQKLRLAQERYSTICLDLLGLIAIGRYQPGDRLPTHDELQKFYGVSRDTTVKAVRMLQDWGVVTAAPRRGISVEMDLEGLKKIQIAPESIACHVRRYLDSLELLSLTVERVVAHAAAYASPEEGQRLHKAIIAQCDQPFEHQLIPRTLLDFITEHIQYDALRSVYRVLSHNFSIGRSIPKLVSRNKNSHNRSVYQQCIEVVNPLIGGDTAGFAKMAAELFEKIRGLIIAECKRLGYWDAAMRVYDGASLWK